MAVVFDDSYLVSSAFQFRDQTGKQCGLTGIFIAAYGEDKRGWFCQPPVLAGGVDVDAGGVSFFKGYGSVSRFFDGFHHLSPSCL